jgi:hypothetical protein
VSFWAKRKKKMPTPPWHGHLLRGITEVSRKLRTAERGASLTFLWKHVPCQTGTLGKRMLSALYGAVDFPNG